jgi:2-hydroxy-3-keto-5-methylthiopentenyl-1-phosphate phosphatase
MKNSTEFFRSMWAIITDFDGTVTLQDVGDAIIYHFGGADISEIRNSYSPGIKVEEWMKDIFGKMKVTKYQIENFVLKIAKIRSGFMELKEFCKKSGVPLEIVSGGLDIYADCVLDKCGAIQRRNPGATPPLKRSRRPVGGNPRMAPMAPCLGGGVKSFFGKSKITENGIEIDYPYLKGMSLEEFKASRVSYYRKKGYQVIFCGDGTSDFPAAKEADEVFAGKYLHSICRKEKIKTHKLTTFFPVRRLIKYGVNSIFL